MFDNRLDVLSPATAAQQDDAYDLATTGRAAAARPGRACCRRYYHPCPEDPRGGGEGPEGNRRARTVLVALVVPFALFWAGAGYLGVADGLGFLNHTRWTLDPPPGSRSLVAKAAAAAFFRQKAKNY